MRNLLVVRENTAKFALFLIGNTFTSKGGSDPEGVRGGLHLGCGSGSVIYLIVCRRCGEQYVGGCITTVSHSIFETNSGFHVKWRTTGKVSFLFFKSFLLVLTKFLFWRGGWGLAYYSMKF